MRILDHTVTASEEGSTVGQILKNRMKLARSLISRLKFSSAILLDGQEVHTDRRTVRGEKVTVLLRDEKPVWQGLKAFDGTFGVLYEDEDLLAVDKPAPLASIASARQGGDSLEGRVFHYYGEDRFFVYRPVNRLDKGTSGVMLIARNAFCQAGLQKKLHTDDFVRTYLAVTEGIPEEKEGLISRPILREAGGVRRVVSDHGQRAETFYRVLETGRGRALVFLRLYTGRTHQIRVHLSSLGCPVAGDYMYGEKLDALPGRFALHSHTAEFVHPVTEERMKLTAPFPEELKALLG
ncbi:MAG: RluA family pseudouridine synthase [Clostridia bacterium]|nr:RluA family pseudouridine synthase [Clostridia bacterium]